MMKVARKPLALFILEMLAIVPGIAIPSIRDELWTLVVPIAVFIMLLVGLLWPAAGLRGYFAYRRPLLIAAMAAELWIIVVGLSVELPDDIVVASALFSLALLTFFLLTTLNSLPGIIGEYRSAVAMRPDLLFGNGAYLVRGEIFVALGIEFLVATEAYAIAKWNWWAVVAELSALLLIAALRGLFKMRMRRARFVGEDSWLGAGFRLGVWVREIFLFVALFYGVYAFANLYLGLTPFTWAPGDPQGNGGDPQWWGLAFLGASFLVLVPLRGWLKTRLPEPATVRQELGKQLLMWLGLVLMIYGFILIFSGHWAVFGYGGFNFWTGVWISLLGFLMIVPLRAYTLRHEFRGTVKMTTAGLADFPDDQREDNLARRLAVVASLPEHARKEQLAMIMHTVQSQPEERKAKILAAREAVLAQAPRQRRAILMQTTSELQSGDGKPPS
jgi:hypothetical protein